MRPWVPRAAVMAVLYGVGQAAFVAAGAWAPDTATVWSVVLLVVLVSVGLLWAGVEVITDRRPPEWTWFGAALAAAPAAGLLTWILLAVLVDGTGVADLGAAIIGRAAFTALLVLGSATLGARLGWLSLRRRGEGAEDPALDTDDAALAASVPPAATRSGRAPAPRVPRATAERVSGATPSVGGLRSPAQRPSSTEPARATGPTPEPTPVGPVTPEPASSGPATPGSSTARPVDDPAPVDDLEPPVVAVLPGLPARPAPAASARSEPAATAEDDEPSRRRRRSAGLRRPER